MKKSLVLTISILILVALTVSACSAAISQPLQSLSTVPEVIANRLESGDAAADEEMTAAELQQPETEISASSGLLAAYQDSLKDIYTKVNPSVVTIQVKVPISATSFNFGKSEIPFSFPGLPESPEGNSPETPQFQQGLGSGFIWDQEGHIVTNNHVVEGASQIEVTFSDGSSYDATLIGQIRKAILLFFP